MISGRNNMNRTKAEITKKNIHLYEKIIKLTPNEKTHP